MWKSQYIKEQNILYEAKEEGLEEGIAKGREIERINTERERANTERERANTERERANTERERKRADAAEKRIAELEALLAGKQNK